MFRTDLLSIIRSLNTVFTALGICHTSYVDCLLARSEWNCSSILVLLESCLQTCITYTSAECTVADELSETCRVSCQNKFVKFVHLSFKYVWPCIINQVNNGTNRCNNNRCIFLELHQIILYMFRALLCPSSGDNKTRLVNTSCEATWLCCCCCSSLATVF
jgi:hypothetical protein